MTASIGPLRHDAPEVRARVEQLLSEPPFVDAEPGPIRRLLRLLGDTVASFLSDLLGDAISLGLLPWVMVVLGSALLGWLVWRITRGLAVDRSVVEVPATIPSRSPSDWHAEADAAQARGELREALRLRYAAMVAALLDAGVLDDVPGRTVRELDAEVSDTVPGIATEIVDAGRCFEAAVYGNRAVSDEDLEVVATAARLASRQTERRPVGVPR